MPGFPKLRTIRLSLRRVEMFWGGTLRSPHGVGAATRLILRPLNTAATLLTRHERLDAASERAADTL